MRMNVFVLQFLDVVTSVYKPTELIRIMHSKGNGKGKKGKFVSVLN